MANKIFKNNTQLALVIAVGVIALSLITTTTGFVPYAPSTSEVCADTDFGDITSAGTCTDADEVSGDVCVSETEVTEYSCYYNQCSSTTVSCALGDICTQGRCIDPALLV